MNKSMDSNSICFLGSTRDFTKPLFFELLKKYGFKYRKIDNNNYNNSNIESIDNSNYINDNNNNNIGMFVIHKK